jgi:hypothetical protein
LPYISNRRWHRQLVAGVANQYTASGGDDGDPKIAPAISTDEQIVYDTDEGYVTTSGRKVTAQQYHDWRNRKFNEEFNDDPKTDDKSENVADDLAESKKRVKNRIDDMKENMTDAEKSRTTFGAAEVQLKDGTREVWVSSAGKKGYIPPRIRGNDKVVSNKVDEANSENRLNDAEQTIMREAEKQGAEIKALGATRDMCEACQEAAKQKSILDRVATPLKEIKK